MHLLSQASSDFFSPLRGRWRGSPEVVGVTAENIATGHVFPSVSAVSCTTVDLTASFVLPPFVHKFEPHLKQQRTPWRCLLGNFLF